MGGGATVSTTANKCVLLSLFFPLPVPSAEEKTSKKAVLCTQDFKKGLVLPVQMRAVTRGPSSQY
jgi:hypothetical protein